MAGEFKIKTGLLLGAPSSSQPVNSIKDSSISITADASSILVTGKAVYDFHAANTAGGVNWGDIGGSIQNQTDIKDTSISITADASSILVTGKAVYDFHAANTAGGVNWGDIGGSIQNQTDIKDTSISITTDASSILATGKAIYDFFSAEISPIESYQTVQDGSITFNTEKWVDSNRNGLLNQTETSLAFNDTTGVFTLADSGSGWSYYLAGQKYTFSGDSSVSLPGGGGASDDRYYIYINNVTTGALTVSTSVWDRETGQLPVAFIDWESGNAFSKYWMGEERHTMLIDTRMHKYLHNTRGTQFVSGGTLDGPIVAGPGGIGATDASNALGVAATTIADEDIYQTLAALTKPADPTGANAGTYNVLYRTGASSWSWKYEDTPLPESGSYIEYDNGTGLSTATDGQYVNTYLLFTNLNGKARYSIIPGQGAYSTLVDAINENYASFDLSGLPVVEYVAAWQFTWEASAGLSTKGKVALVSAPVRIQVNSATASTPTTEAHNDLIGLQGGSATQRYHLDLAQYNDYIGKSDVDSSLLTIWQKLGNVDTSLNNLGIKNSNQDTSINDIWTELGNIETSIGNIENYWSLDGSILSPVDDTVNVQLSAIQIGTDAGTVSVIDMDVSSATAGTEESYSFNIDGTQIAKVYAEGDGAAGIQEPAFKVLETLYAESSVYFTAIPDVSTSYVLFYNPTSDAVSYAEQTSLEVITQLSALSDVSIGGIGATEDGSILVYNNAGQYWTYWSIDSNITWGEIGGTLSDQTDLYNPWLQDLSTNISNRLKDTTDTFTGTLTVDGSLIVNNDVQIGGSLTVDGSIYAIGVETIDVSGAYINMNTGFVGSPPDTMQSGIIVSRGSDDPYAILYDETDEQFRIGITTWNGTQYEDSSTQAVATREDSPLDGGIAIWNGNENRFDSVNPSTYGFDTSTFISLFDTPNSYLDGSSGSAVVMNDTGDGLEFASRIWREDANEVTLANENADVLFYENIEIEPDSGVGTFVDKSVTASSAPGTDESYTFNMDGTTIAKIYAKSDGAGSIYDEKFVSSVAFQAESSVYFTDIPDVSTSYVLFYDITTKEVTYASQGSISGVTQLSALTDVSIGGTIPDGSALIYNSAGSYWTYGVAGGAGGDYWTLDGSTLVPTDSTVDVKLGQIEIDEDAGAVTLSDMPVSSTPTAGTEESYSFDIDGSTVAKVWGEADGNGALQEYGFVVETAQYMGDPNTNGSWRFYPDSNGDLVFEKRISGTWTEKGKFTE